MLGSDSFGAVSSAYGALPWLPCSNYFVIHLYKEEVAVYEQEPKWLKQSI